jgi:CO dehydrogenase/acetyl-CoA synthase gamma subunit (corrinoid Fe-S protein)
MKTLKAKEGYYLTQSADVAIQDRVISDCLYLPDTVDVSTWKEITDTQATDYRKQLETYNASLTSTDVVDNSLTEAIEKKLQDIADYDNSDAVNSFTYNNIPLWFSAETRAGFKNSIESASLLGETTISIPTTAGIINLPLNDAKIMLAKIQTVRRCVLSITTLQHKQEVAKLTNITDVEAYDITKGYPDKLVF